MDGKGAWRDSVLVERLWKTIKYEEVKLHAHASTRRYLGFYASRKTSLIA